jgi:hypothetical protein
LAPIVHQLTARPVTYPYLPLVASLAASAGDQVMVPPGLSAAGGGAVGTPGAGGAYVGGVGGTGAGDTGC